MHQIELDRWQHAHDFGTGDVSLAEQRTRWVVALTVVMMVVELIAGTAFGSMALLADGWHMASHVAALGISAFAYAFARRHADDERYTFGTGKVTALGGFASAIGLGIVAALVLAESTERLMSAQTVRFDEAIFVAAIGLLVNLLSAALLHGADHHHEHKEGHHDHNLRGAYLHVLADALTSILAIGALIAGKYLGWIWMDALTGILGSIVIGRWSLGLLRETSAVLLDADPSKERRRQIIDAIEGHSTDQISDLHLWRIGPRHYGAILSIVSHHPKEPIHYKKLISRYHDLAHVTVEVHPCSSAHDSAGACIR